MSPLRQSALAVLLQVTLASTVTLPSSESPPNPCRGVDQFHCKNGGQQFDCLPVYWICDEIKNCADGSDEDATLCENYHENASCNLTDHFECTNSRCLPNSFKCDGDIDCPTGEDEANCTAISEERASCGQNSLVCDDNRCVSRNFICDTLDDCADGADEMHCNCTTGHPFHCADGLRCPPLSAVCDGTMDCKDSSDEGGLCDDASCSLDCEEGKCYKTPTGPRCPCEDGFRENVKNSLCEDIDECAENSPCDHFCANTKGSYNCMCKMGYALERKHMCKTYGNSPLFLFFSDHFEVKAMNLATNDTWQVYAGGRVVTAVAYDPVPEEVYWADMDEKVYRKSLRGEDDPALLINSDLEIVYSMAIDWVGRNLYMADREKNRIVVCNVNRITCKSLLTRSITPAAIKLDIAERLIYWTNLKEPGIMKANMDGSSVITLARGDLVWPNALGIDPPARKLYWMDSKTDSVEQYNLDRGTRKVIAALKEGHPYSMAVWEDKIYWSDWETRTLYSAHKTDGRNVTQVCPNFYGHSIAIYHEQMLMDARSEANPCKSSDCSHLCLLSPIRPFFTCACPLGHRLARNRASCIASDESPLSTLIAGVGKNLYKLEMREFLDPSVKRLTRADTNFKRISDLDYDPVTKDLFISDQRDGKIIKLNLETKLKTILINDGARPAGIAVDWSRRNLYWVDSMKNTLEVVTTDGRFRTRLHLDEFCSGLDVEVSQSAGRVVVACGLPRARIVSCTRQGEPCTVLTNQVRTPIGLTIDRNSVPDFVYWADAEDSTVQRVSLDGSHKQVFAVRSPAAVLFSNNKLFVSTFGHFDYILAKTNASTPNAWDKIHLNTQENPQSWRHKGHIALTAIDWHVEQVYTRSYEQFCLANTACEQLCLENELKERVCGCSTGLVLSDDHHSCVQRLCPPDDFLCPDDASCISNTFKCNGVRDCSDGADENSLMCYPCRASSFHCNSGDCVDLELVCDGHAHCNDKSDEADCKQQHDLLM